MTVLLIMFKRNQDKNMFTVTIKKNYYKYLHPMDSSIHIDPNCGDQVSSLVFKLDICMDNELGQGRRFLLLRKLYQCAKNWYFLYFLLDIIQAVLVDLFQPSMIWSSSVGLVSTFSYF